jgi:hypothetical protein
LIRIFLEFGFVDIIILFILDVMGIKVRNGKSEEKTVDEILVSLDISI